MKVSLRLWIVALCFLSVPGIAQRRDTQILDLSHDSTVRVESKPGNSSGSGFFVGDKLVLTCLHVVVSIQPAGTNVNLVPMKDIHVILPSGEDIPAHIASFPTQSDTTPAVDDFAFLQLDHRPTGPFTKVELAGDGEKFALGDDVVFSGYPLSVPGMVTHRGMISGSNDSYGLIFVEAPINKGNSGGALLNPAGHVIGIISMREGGISEGLAKVRAQIRQTSASGQVRIMGVDTLGSLEALIDTLDQYINTGIGYARSIRFARDYLLRHPEIAK